MVFQAWLKGGKDKKGRCCAGKHGLLSRLTETGYSYLSCYLTVMSTGYQSTFLVR